MSKFWNDFFFQGFDNVKECANELPEHAIPLCIGCERDFPDSGESTIMSHGREDVTEQLMMTDIFREKKDDAKRVIGYEGLFFAFFLKKIFEVQSKCTIYRSNQVFSKWTMSEKWRWVSKNDSRTQNCSIFHWGTSQRQIICCVDVQKKQGR